MLELNLNGQWDLIDADNDWNLSATVPGCVHTDLLSAGVIDDPFYRNNEEKLQWIGDKIWIYSRTFEVSSELLANENIVLACDGLDTLCEIKINQTSIAKTDNMFRKYEFSIKDFLVLGSNRIEIVFFSAPDYIRQKQSEKHLHSWMQYEGNSWIRKEHCNFGWDWGPTLVTAGIWKDIRIQAYSHAIIKDIFISQSHSQYAASLSIDVNIENQSMPISGYLSILNDGEEIASQRLRECNGDICFLRSIENPKLWWPNGMGAQNLYYVKVQIFDDNGNLLDEKVKRVGLRTISLDLKNDEYGQSFEFVVNRVPFFAKGANWIPADVFQNRVSYGLYRDLLSKAADANMNTIRVWGGGVYESDEFYDICDELGLCVWQDFMFACATYPTYDNNFVDNFKCEVKDNVKRIRHHACLALWCGNNELEMGLVSDQWTRTSMSWEDYTRLFDDILPDLLKELTPQIDYWPCSPHSAGDKRADWNSEISGDAHLWDVWHGMQPFEWFKSCNHRFVSEFGFQSFPEPKVVNGYTDIKDRYINSHVMDSHQKSGRGNSKIMGYMAEWSRMPHDFNMLLWMSQILQANCIKVAVEHFRANMPRTMGVLYWQLNDCWPGPSWSSIDYYGNLKALHYYAKRFFAPLLITGNRLGDIINIVVVNELYEPIDVSVSYEIMNYSGEVIEQDSQSLAVNSFSVNEDLNIDVSKCLEKHSSKDIFVRIVLKTNNEIVSENVIHFEPPKYTNYQKPEIALKVVEEKKTEDGCEYLIEISTDKPAFDVHLEALDGQVVFSDNFFTLMPSQKKIVVLKSKSVLRESLLQILSLYAFMGVS